MTAWAGALARVVRAGLIMAGIGACLGCATTAAMAGRLDRAAIEKAFPPPLMVGDKDETSPIWPILKQNGGAIEVFAYAFESNDFAPIPGFGGEPPDLLIALAPDGTFRDVKVLSQHEPVFVDGLGPEPLFAFVQQYVGMSARHSLRVGRPNARANGAPLSTTVDGVAMATASTRVINEELLGSALAVARRKLGFGAASTAGLRVVAKPDGFVAMDWKALIAKGYVKRFRLTNADVDKAFADADVETPSAGPPNDVFADTYIAYLNVPSIGRNLLGDKDYARTMNWLGPGDHAILVLAAGPWTPIGDDFVLGSIPEKLAIIQDGLQLNARDMADERNGRGMAGMPAGDWSILKLVEQGGFDPAKPWTFSLKVTRSRGQILAQAVTRDFATTYALPASLFSVEKPDAGPTWVESWVSRWPELAVITLMLAVLVPVLVRQRGLVADAKRLELFRLGFLTVTLGFIGWYAQAQLSIVTIVGAVRAATSTRDFSFLLYDPPSLLLWGFTLVTLAIWGRGTFCGWLCPFGAVQELAAFLARPLKLRQLVIPPRLDRALRGVKYVVLVGIVVSAATSNAVADKLVEVEPFKTSITLYFVRYWPFTVYALGLIGLNLFVYKGFCRYLCPLGASLAVVGRVRMFDWIPRRVECGSPCQLCKVKCRYGAIEASGTIDYPECFQCMDCVTIINDPDQCVPQILARKKGKSPRLATAAE